MPKWSSRLAFLAAAVGSAVGLGSIWKFPYIVGANGGGAFVLVYLVFVALVGIPLMAAELVIGRRGGTGLGAIFGRLLGVGAQRRTRWAGWPLSPPSSS